MALGLARMFGIELPWNFNRPYRAASPREFWTRWHVTLSTWLRDYLYIPLGGSRRGPARRDANLLATMGLGGLWHGASANFALWGLYHGTLLVGNHHLARLRIRIPRVAAVALTFVLVTIGWVFFRMRTAGDTLDMLAAMAGANGLGQFPGHTALYVVISAVLMWGFTEEWQLDLGSWRYLRVATLAVVTSFTIVSLQLAHPFIYFKF
jgi:D-alanyl-lipoteichoic acid acyltransferase DltB (MBOAT superfamily)